MTKKKILTTHVGSLPRSQALLDANLKRANGDISEDAFQAILETAVDELVEKQKNLGIDLVNEGE